MESLRGVPIEMFVRSRNKASTSNFNVPICAALISTMMKAIERMIDKEKVIISSFVVMSKFSKMQFEFEFPDVSSSLNSNVLLGNFLCGRCNINRKLHSHKILRHLVPTMAKLFGLHKYSFSEWNYTINRQHIV